MFGFSKEITLADIVSKGTPGTSIEQVMLEGLPETVVSNFRPQTWDKFRYQSFEYNKKRYVVTFVSEAKVTMNGRTERMWSLKINGHIEFIKVYYFSPTGEHEAEKPVFMT